MRTVLVTLAILAVEGSTNAALAQVPLARPPQTYAQFVAQMERDRADRSRRDQSRYSASQTAERRERATRLSAMANVGQCDEAIVIARQEGDSDMAFALERACSRSQ